MRSLFIIVLPFYEWWKRPYYEETTFLMRFRSV